MIQITREKLPNGLTLLFLETHQAPVTSINICVRVGSRFETDQESGICHLIEHMLFKGTKKMAPGEVAKQIEASGGDVNAYTSFDETVYYCTLSSRHTLKGLEVLSDAVLNSLIDPEELDREREVVVEEILRGKDSPTRVLSESLFTKTFQKHHYGRPIIGFEKTVRGFSRDFVYNFYRRWYVPENMVVVLSGDFNTAKMRKHCQKIFGKLPKKSPPKSPCPNESIQRRCRTLAIQNPVKGHNMAFAFHSPELDHPDIPALDILSHILGEGESSRLGQEVYEKQGLVNGISSYVYSPANPGLFYISYSLPGKNIKAATTAIWKEIHRLQQEKVDHDTLVRAKLNIKSDAIYEKETVEGLARKHGYFETILSRHDFDEHYYQAIDQVTPEDILSVAKKYLRAENLTAGLIQPKDDKKKWNKTELLNLIERVAKPPRIKKSKKPPVTYIKLKNGFRLILKENPSVPTITIRSAHLGGLRAEDKTNNGIHTLFSRIWGKSTKHLDAQNMARECELIAGSIGAYAGKNLCGLKADFLSEKTTEGTKLFLDAFLNPRFDRQEIAREKSNIIEAIHRENDALSSLTFKRFLQNLYPTHPYGMSLLGEAKNVRSFKDRQLQKAQQQLLDPKQSVISVVGDFDIQAMLDLMGPALENLPRNSRKTKAPATDPAPKEHIRTEKILEKFQAHIVYGFRGLKFSDRDRYALDVLNNILSGQGGRLFLELRDKLSLAYSVTALTQEGIEPGYFGVYIGTEGSKVNQAIDGIERELGHLLKHGIKTSEMKRAQQYMVGAYEIELQRNAMVGTQLAFNEIYNIPRDEWKTLPQKIMRVTQAQVESVARKVVQLDRSILSIVRPPTSPQAKS